MSIELPLVANKRKRPSQATIRLLLAFVLLFAVALVSGFFYYLVPRDWNWAASKAALIIHIISGIASLIVFIPYVIAHQQDEEANRRNLLMPWLAFRREAGESDWIYKQRIYGHILNWSVILLGLSGIAVSLPGLLWLGGFVWLPDYLAYQVSNAIHLGLTFITLAFIGLHLVRRRRNNRRKGGQK
ncbi:MAG TPA: hypothetical protein EYP90_08845 [Chromatiaceae bacterium]|nr:hypothetical protein [Chromatiaceae bacterium]